MATRETIVARLAEWGLTLSEREIDQLVPAYENLLRWQGVLEDMMHSKKLVEGMTAPASEPILIHAHERSDDRTERISTMDASTQELAFASISAVAESVRKKELSPVELVRASLGRIEALDSKLNSFYTLFRDDVMAAARAAEAEIARGQYRGPLHGIPIGIKDIYECGPTTCGSKSLKDY